jgi:hypothetical protein
VLLHARFDNLGNVILASGVKYATMLQRLPIGRWKCIVCDPRRQITQKVGLADPAPADLNWTETIVGDNDYLGDLLRELRFIVGVGRGLSEC